MARAETQTGTLLSIGYGDRSWDDFLVRLRRHDVEFLIDVRSRPRSRLPEFNRDLLQSALKQGGIEYVYMGDALGGQPDDPTCYIAGKVDYERCESRPCFQAALDRLVAALNGGHRVAIMCSELDPERCHRSKLIGEALRSRQVPLFHMDRHGALVSQEEVIDRVTGGQAALFDYDFRSNGRYEPQSSPR